MEYVDYFDHHYKDPAEYAISYDAKGPQYWKPSQCIARLDWARPKRASPYIGIIGT